MLDRLSISKKIFIGFGLVLALVVAQALYTGQNLTQVANRVDLVVQRQFREATDSIHLVGVGDGALNYLAAAADSALVSDIEKAESRREVLFQKVAELRESLADREAFQSGLQEYVEVFETVFTAGKEMAGYAVDQDILEMITAKEVFDEHYASYQEVAARFQGSSNAALRDNLMAANSLAQKTIRNTQIVSLVGILAGVLLALRIGRKITVPVRAMVNALENIAQGEGDLTRRLAVSTRDEIGEASRCFNLFVERIESMVKKVSQNSDAVAGAAQELASVVEVMSATIGQQNDHVQQVASATTELSASFSEVAENTHAVADVSTKVSDRACQGKETVARTVGGMEDIAAQVREISTAVASVGESCTEITQILEVIDDIADQTNLLALNANIEAARAGNQGRGFAVVADEVRKLAERTGSATEKVTAIVGKLQGNVSNSVAGIESGLRVVEEGRRLADEAQAELDGIVEVSTRGSEMVNQIAAATEEQSATSNEISQNIDNILAEAERTEAAANTVGGETRKLTTLSGELKEMVSLFKVG